MLLPKIEKKKSYCCDCKLKLILKYVSTMENFLETKHRYVKYKRLGIKQSFKKFFYYFHREIFLNLPPKIRVKRVSTLALDHNDI